MLVAISKRQSVASIQAAFHAGQRRFGESYVQEAVPKLRQLEGMAPEWHFIGRIQSNKTRAIAEHFSWVHTLERDGIARRLSEQRPRFAPPLNVLLQVSLAGEERKGGVAPEDLRQLAATVSAQPRLALRGLMTVPPAGLDADATVELYARLRSHLAELTEEGYALDTLSMGMSGDFELAIAAGSNCVRIGTAIFGERD